MNSGIYAIMNTTNRKLLVGSTKDFDVRKYNHFMHLKNKTHANIILQRAYDKYGINNFEFIVLEECEDNLFDREAYHMKKYNSMCDEHGYNIAPPCGGDTLSRHPYKDVIFEKIATTIKANCARLTKDERSKIWGKKKEDNPNWQGGKTYCEICESGRAFGANTICRDCRIPKNRSGKHNSFYGCKHSSQTKQHMSKIRKEIYENMTDEDYKNHPQTVSVSIDGVITHGLSRAGRLHGTGPALVRYRCLSKTEKWKDWFYVG